MTQIMTLVSFNDLEPAAALAARLRAAHYNAEVRDDSNEQKWKLFNLHPLAHMQIVVPEAEHERAAKQLAEWDAADGALALAVRCPSCRSTRVEYPQFSRRTIMGALPAALAAAGVIEKNFYCEACHFTWPANPPEPGPELDMLNWPKKPAAH
jgi:hypothetical protein